MARWILAKCLDSEPSRIRILREEHGKPYVANAQGLAFSLSHSEGAVLSAVGYTELLGTDIEFVQRTSSMVGVVATYFTLPERLELAKQSYYEAERTSLRWWTVKESFLKADGHGIGISPTAICCSRDRLDGPGDLEFRAELLGYKESTAYQGEVVCGWDSHWISWASLGREEVLRPCYLEWLGGNDFTHICVSDEWHFCGMCP